MKTKTVSLNGEWQYRIGYGEFSSITVPFSRLPVGRSECIKGFDLCEDGEPVAEIIISFADGSEEIIPLLNGEHITTAFMLNGSSRINPRAELTNRPMTFNFDKNYEQYLINRMDISLLRKDAISRIEIISKDGSYLPLIYSLLVK